ncbi:hypothetical protein MOSL_0680 [Moraxella osloensis]|nr:hypothetical protein MOSL_0680 [Moraxella osloensis]
MTHRSAPFVAPNLHLTQSDGSDNSDNGNPSALLVDEKSHKKQVKLLLSTLQADITQFRDNFFSAALSDPNSRFAYLCRQFGRGAKL